MILQDAVELLCPSCGKNDWRVGVGPWGPVWSRAILDCSCEYRMSLLMPNTALDQTGPVKLGGPVKR